VSSNLLIMMLQLPQSTKADPVASFLLSLFFEMLILNRWCI